MGFIVPVCAAERWFCLFSSKILVGCFLCIPVIPETCSRWYSFLGAWLVSDGTVRSVASGSPLCPCKAFYGSGFWNLEQYCVPFRIFLSWLALMFRYVSYDDALLGMVSATLLFWLSLVLCRSVWFFFAWFYLKFCFVDTSGVCFFVFPCSCYGQPADFREWSCQRPWD